ncbi:SagB/ThcOx family dehydrogenase [Halovivax gelatinilyticus]|uniref:SagB/ThcOx family dehydrogenase n=1 Tax=Halovivax gelatinilyticus TaxID=2961597 RepID=UPI0020CA4DD8|nr:SagB/ThcOx family dehydrogenase [Halovivax gelatinilyticus]
MTDARDIHAATNHEPDDIHAPDDRDSISQPRPTKRYRDVHRIDLDTVSPPWDPTLSLLTETRTDPLADTDQTDRAELDRTTVATLCYEAMGITSEVDLNGTRRRFRAASCTGKLYHVECYVVCAALPALDAGVYHFDPETLSLDVLREGDVRGVIAAAAGDRNGDTSSGSTIADAPVSIVTTSNWWRNAWKYADRTYIHAFWDTGTVLSNLLAAAHGLDLPASVLVGFADDPIVHLLGLDPSEEAPLSIVPVGCAEPVSEPVRLGPFDPDVVPVAETVGSVDRIHAAWEASTLSDAGAVIDWRERARAYRGDEDESSVSGDRIELEPVDHDTASARPLHPVVVRRGSCREYADRGPSARQLATVLDRATRGVPGDWNDGEASGLEYLDAYVLATNVDGVPDGTYQYRPSTDAMIRIGDCDTATKTHLALDQSWAGDAHVNVYLLADVDAAVDALGNRGYRLVQLEAGLTLGRLYLATYAHRDLGGVGLTFFDRPVGDHLCGRSDGRLPMTMFAFGRRGES